jgi:outer membrane protein assembly factor BamB
MSDWPRPAFLVSIFVAFLSTTLIAQKDSGWRISPYHLNIQVGDDRVLQLLDDSAQELHGAMWSVDDPEKSEIREEDGRTVLRAKSPGTVRVSAALGGEIRFREIDIWPIDEPLKPGTSKWGTEPIGREIKDLPAVPTPDAPTVYSLEQTDAGNTYLRAFRDDGIQVWAWRMPEQTRDVELVCGDWLGGALISANHVDSFTLYTVGKDGKQRWRYTLPGLRKGHAYTLNHLIHVISQAQDGTGTTITGLDEVTGARNFQLTLPPSIETLTNVKRVGTNYVCIAQSLSGPMRTITSHLFVNIDGFAYVAFTQHDWSLKTGKCLPGSAVAPQDVGYVRKERVVLWQIHPDGTYRSTIIEESKNKRPITESVSPPSPTGSIIPDGLGGVLLSLRWSHDTIVGEIHTAADELIYRIDEDGHVVYKLPLPKYDGAIHDEMVLGEDEIGFATRGSFLIAFNVRDGRELWRWNSNTSDIEVFAALANGHCLVQTPTALVEVANANEAKEVLQGKAMMGWHGDVYLKHN